MSAIHVQAPAKVNLALRVLGRRENGYHELDTLFQAVSLSDTVVLTERRRPGVELRVTGADVGPTEDNLALRAARAWQVATGIDAALDIRLTKRIPAGAGLGGGSSDAGAVLRGLEAMYGSPLGPARLARVGAELGADVAFFCGSAGLARGRGVGDDLSALPELPTRPLLIVTPGTPVSTPAAYGWLAAERDAGAPVSEPFSLPDAPDWSDIDRVHGNDFHAVVERRVAQVERVARAMEAAGVMAVLLSGSGSALFGVLPSQGSEEIVTRVEASVSDTGARVLGAETLARLPEPRPIAAQA